LLNMSPNSVIKTTPWALILWYSDKEDLVTLQ
jgi:hypothetical protein